MRCVSTRPGCRAKQSSRSYWVGVSTTASPRTRTSRDAESISIGPRASRLASTRAPERLALGVAQADAHARQQLGQREGLDDVVVGAQVERLHLGLVLAPRRQDDDRRRGEERAYAADDLEPVEARQAEVEQDQVGRCRRGARAPPARRLSRPARRSPVSRAPRRPRAARQARRRRPRTRRFARVMPPTASSGSSRTNVAPPPGVVIDADGAAVRLHEAAGDGEAEAARRGRVPAGRSRR